MKTLFLAALVGIAASSCAQRLPASKVPSVVQNTLQAKFAKASDPDWDKKKNVYEAEFRIDSTEYTVYIDETGHLLQYQFEIAPAAVPVTITERIGRDHAGFTIDDVEKMEKDGVTYYLVELEAKGKKDKYLLCSIDGRPVTNISYIQ